MSVVSSHAIDDSASIQDGKISHAAKFRVKTDAPDDPAIVAIVGSQSALPDPTPAYFSTFALNGSADANAFCKSIKATRARADSDRRTWLVDVSWSPLEGQDASDDTTSEDDPLLKPVKYWVEWEEIQVVVEEAWNVEALPGISRSPDTKGPVQNGAGQELSSGLTRPIRVPVLAAQKNYATLQEIIALGLSFDDSVSSDEYYGADPGKSAFRGIECSQPQYGGGIEYYSGIIRVAFREDGWNIPIVNRGWKYLDAGKLKEATVKNADNEDVPVAEPINLELNGTRTADGSVGTVINYRVSREIAYSGLGI